MKELLGILALMTTVVLGAYNAYLLGRQHGAAECQPISTLYTLPATVIEAKISP